MTVRFNTRFAHRGRERRCRAEECQRRVRQRIDALEAAGLVRVPVRAVLLRALTDLGELRREGTRLEGAYDTRPKLEYWARSSAISNAEVLIRTSDDASCRKYVATLDREAASHTRIACDGTTGGNSSFDWILHLNKYGTLRS